MDKKNEQRVIDLTNPQKKFLRKLGHDLSAVISIGKEGLPDSIIEAIDDALLHHELIKVKLVPSATVTKQVAAQTIPTATNSCLVQLIGKTLLLYRPNPKRKKEERIRLPSPPPPSPGN